MRKLEALLNPGSIALIGASRNLNKLNGRPFKFLLDKGYRGKIYPVNPNYEEIAGLTCYPDVGALPEVVDLAVVMVPAAAVADAMLSLGAKGVPAAVVFSSGFSETGAEGLRMEEQVRDIAARYNISLCGPNCLGLINSFESVMATFSQFANGDTPPGPVGFVTQSGAFGTAIAALARNSGLGLGYFVNTGNEAGVGFAQVMQDVLADPRIRVGAGYIEGLSDGDALAGLARQALAHDKPLVITKVGRTSAGARAAASHTGSLAGEDAIFQGICDQFGIIRADDEEHLLDVLSGFAVGTKPAGRRIGLITQSGGAGVLMADKAAQLNLQVTTLDEATTARLREVVPAFGSVANPVDITAQFIAEPDIFRDSVKAVMADPGVDIGVVWFQLMHEFVDTLEKVFRDIAAALNKPLLVCWVAGPADGLQRLRDLGFPVFRSAGAAMAAADAMVRYVQGRDFYLADKAPPLTAPATLEGIGIQPTLTTHRLLTEQGVNLVPSAMCVSADEAVRSARQFGYPVVVKIESVDIPHKTDIGGVRLGLSDDDAVREAFRSVTSAARDAHPKARLDGVVVQAMNCSPAVELVIGLKHDPVFGMVVMLGMGGIALEISRDVVFRKAPVSEGEALRMIDSLAGAALLGEVRGRPPIDRHAVAQLVSAVSVFGTVNAERIAELDINPVMATPNGAQAVDWLLVTHENPANQPIDKNLNQETTYA